MQNQFYEKPASWLTHNCPDNFPSALKIMSMMWCMLFAVRGPQNPRSCLTPIQMSNYNSTAVVKLHISFIEGNLLLAMYTLQTALQRLFNPSIVCLGVFCQNWSTSHYIEYKFVPTLMDAIIFRHFTSVINICGYFAGEEFCRIIREKPLYF